jgi:SAM-dependent methyltransferase
MYCQLFSYDVTPGIGNYRRNRHEEARSQMEFQTPQSPEALRNRVQQYRIARVYLTFADLKIAESLEDGPLTLSSIAERTDCDVSGLQRFLAAAEALGLVETHDDLFALTPFARRAYAPSSEESIGNYLRLESRFYERWATLPVGVRSGGRPAESRAQESSPDWIETFTRALFDNARRSGPAIATAINKVIPEPSDNLLRLLDVGGGHGAYAMAIASVRPDVRATVLDLPPVIEVARQIIDEQGMSETVDAVAGDFHRDDIGANLDVVLLFGVLHGETPDNAERLLQSIHDSLSNDGVLLIRAHGSRRGAPATGERELMDLHMLISTDGGVVRKSVDTTEIVVRQGFSAEPPIPNSDEGNSSILVFRKRS